MDNFCYKPDATKNQAGPYTHFFLDGGVASLNDKDQLGIREAMVQDIKNKTMPPITENRPMWFAYFVDLDLLIKKSELSKEAVVELAKIMNGQAKLFFPEDHEELICIACDKYNHAPLQPIVKPATALGVPSEMYKHGIHFHWPDVIVSWEQAMYMRSSMIAALERTDWMVHFGLSTIDWEDVFDKSVYGRPDGGGGLRIVHAPKAKQCDVCHNKKSSRDNCINCEGKGTLIIPSYYKFCVALKGCRVDESLGILGNEPALLLKLTSIRGKVPRQDRTSGTNDWMVYPGCPTYEAAAKSGRKRKMEPDVGKKFASNEVVDEEKGKVVSKYLQNLSENYEKSSFKMYTDGKSVKAFLRGDGARFCRNLDKGYHNGASAYMVIEQKGRNYYAWMRCTCKCKTIEGRRSGIPCSKFNSCEKMLSSEDAATLFGTDAAHDSLVKANAEAKKIKML